MYSNKFVSLVIKNLIENRRFGNYTAAILGVKPEKSRGELKYCYTGKGQEIQIITGVRKERGEKHERREDF